MKKLFIITLLALSTISARPMNCPGGWLRNDGWTKDRIDSVEISVESTTFGSVVRFTSAIGVTITKVCVNGQKRILRYTAPNVVVNFQVSELTGYYLYDAAVKFK